MPPTSKKGSKQRARAYTKVSRLNNFLRSIGENREVDEREISSPDRIQRFQSVSDLLALFARKPRAVLWLCRHVYLYKRSRLSSSLDLLSILRSYRGLRIEVTTAGDETHSFDLHWKRAKQTDREVTVATDRLFRLLARDGRISSIVTTLIGVERDGFLPLSPKGLGRFVSAAASPRTVSFPNAGFTREQSPMLFSNKEGSVTIQELDVSVLHDEGMSLLQAVKESFGLQELHLLQVNRMSETFFTSLMTCLAENKMIRTLSIGLSSRFGSLSEAQTRALADVFRLNTSVTTFNCLRCYLSDEKWKLLWNAIKVNTSLADVDVSSSPLPSWCDNIVVDALKVNTSVVRFSCSSTRRPKRNLTARIEPFLERNRTQKLLRCILTDNCQSKRWMFLRHSLRKAKVHGRGPGVLYAILRPNVDNWVSYAPTGREVVHRQLQRVEAQRLVLLAKLRQYDEPVREGSPGTTRKRKRGEDESTALHGGNGSEADA